MIISLVILTMDAKINKFVLLMKHQAKIHLVKMKISKVPLHERRLRSMVNMKRN